MRFNLRFRDFGYNDTQCGYKNIVHYKIYGYSICIVLYNNQKFAQTFDAPKIEYMVDQIIRPV
jgi:hypothetical protein